MSGPWNLGWGNFFSKAECVGKFPCWMSVFFDVVESWCVFCGCWYWPQLRSCLIKDPTSKMITFIASSSECLNNRRRRLPGGSSAYFAGWFTSWNMNDFRWTDSIWKWLCKKDDSINVFCGDERPTLYFMIVAQVMLMYLSRDWRTRISWKAGYVKGLLRFPSILGCSWCSLLWWNYYSFFFSKKVSVYFIQYMPTRYLLSKLESVFQLNQRKGLPKSNLFCGSGAHAFVERLESSEDVDETEWPGWPGAFCCRWV